VVYLCCISVYVDNLGEILHYWMLLDVLQYIQYLCDIVSYCNVKFWHFECLRRMSVYGYC